MLWNHLNAYSTAWEKSHKNAYATNKKVSHVFLLFDEKKKEKQKIPSYSKWATKNRMLEKHLKKFSIF